MEYSERFTNEHSENTWKDRYKKNNESVEGNFRRVAAFAAKNKEEEKEFFMVMDKGYFYPAGRTMSNAGIGTKLGLNNCFVAPQIMDNYEDIFDKVKLGAITHQRGGGIGYEFSQLRPKGSPTSNGAIASGAVSFMDVFNTQTETTIQGQRRGANMGVMSVYSMDIETFINAKAEDAEKLEHFNLSVMVDDNFITAVREDKNVWLHHPVYNEIGQIETDSSKWLYRKEVPAKEIWDKIMKRAYENGEPGIFFYDNLNNDNNLWYIERIVCSNPCAEYLAGTVYGVNPITEEKLDSREFGGACNLGSLFLHNFIENPFTEYAFLNKSKLSRTIQIAVKMLDNIIDVNRFPDPIYKNYQDNFRTIGLGFTGFADALVMLNLKYNSQKARDFAEDLVDFIAFNAYTASVELAKERGSFPFLDKELFTKSGYIEKHAKNDPAWRDLQNKIKLHGIRNAKLLSIAPTGTLSMTFGNNCSSGLEPIFALEYDRKVKIGGQTDDNIKIIKLRDYAYDQWLKVKDNPDCIVKEDVFITALNMTVDEHVDMLGAIAKHVDMSCSKTINVPEEYSFEDTKNIYMKCHDLGIKGCTIFRPNELRPGVFITNSNSKEKTPSVDTMVGLPRGYIVKVDNNAIGKERHLTTGCGSLHCAAFFDPDTGDLLETYLSKGSTGGCQSNLAAESRLMSLLARGGIDIYSIVDQLKSCMACPSYAVRTATKGDTSKGNSCPSAVAFALLDMYEEMQKELGINDEKDEKEEIEVVTEKIIPVKKFNVKKKKVNPMECPECGEPLTAIGGCFQCDSCGYSRCD